VHGGGSPPSGLPSPICSPRGGYTAFAIYTPFEGTSVGEAMDAEVTKLLPEHVSREVRHALFQGVCDPHGAHASEVLVVDPPDHPRLSLVHLPDLAVAGNDVAQGLGAAMDMSFLHALVDALGDSFPDHLPLEFGEHGQHLEEGPAGRVTSVKGFRHAAEAAPMPVKLVHQLGEVGDPPGKAVHLPNEDQVHAAGLHVFAEAGEMGLVEGGAGVALVGVDADHIPTLGPAKSK